MGVVLTLGRRGVTRAAERVNILWLFIIDECRYDCENGIMTVTYWRLFGFTVRKRSTRRLA